jgi:hypothetical protein
MREHTSDMYRIQEENVAAEVGVHNTTIKEVSIRGIEENLVEAEVEGILEEEEEDRLYVTTVINLDTWPMTSRIHV